MGRRTQQERSSETRLQLLEATLNCIMERGLAGTTTTAISNYAGVSRGAQLHHYPNRLELITAATEHLFTSFADDVELLAQRAGDPSYGLSGFLDGLWDQMFRGRFFFASLELIVAARSDPVLHSKLVPLIRNLHGRLDATWQGFFERTGLTQARVETLLNMTLCLMRGMAVQTVLREDPPYYQEMIESWESILKAFIRQSEGSGLPRRPKARDELSGDD